MPWEPPGPRIDPFTKLPADVVQYLSNFLKVHDVLVWRMVCKGWKEMLTNPALSKFWRRASEYAGVPHYYIERLQPECNSVDDVFHQARYYTDHIARIDPETKVLRGTHPFESSTKCHYAGSGYFVRSVNHQSLEKEETVIGELCPYRRTIQKVASVTGTYGEVTYASCFANNIIWQTSEGYWFRYSLENHSCVPLFEKLIKKQNGDSVGHCRHCLFMVIANSVSIIHNYNWKLNLFKFEGDSMIESIHAPPIPSKITQFIPRPVKAHIVSEDNCKTHRLIVQGGTGACVFDLTHDSKTKKIDISSKPITTLNPFYDSDAPVMVVTTTSEIVLSLDESFIALLTSIVYPSPSGLCLHLFDLKTYQRSLSIKIKWADGFNDSRLLAISQLYAIVGVGHSNGIVKIVHCRSGNVISSVSQLSKGLPPVIPMAKLTMVHMQGVYGEECLYDIKGKLNMAVVFQKGTGNMEGVFYDPYPPSLALLEDSNRVVYSDSENEASNQTSG